MKVGDFIRYDQVWSIDMTNEPIWVLIEELRTPQQFVGLVICGNEHCNVRTYRQGFRWSSYYPYDAKDVKVFHVSQNEVPDYVWAKLAEWKLSQ